jgi:hypothetical protein
VFGAEHRRLEMAGKMLLESCANAKRFGQLQDAQLQQQAKALVDGTNKTSSDLMIFNSYVQARSKETEGPKQGQLTRAVGQFNDLNQQLVETCNTLLKGISQSTRTPFVRTVDEIARITREILDMLTPPENLDIFKVIQDLYNKGNMAVLTSAQSLDAALKNWNGRDVSADDLFREGEEVKRSLVPVRGHKGFREKDDVANHTNVSSAKVARYNNLLADFIAGDKIPALKPVLSGCHADMNAANERLVRATNDYLAAVGGDDGLKVHRAHATPARDAPNAAAENAKPGITAAAKRVVLATSQAVKAGTDRDQFVPAARDTSDATKQLLTAVDELAKHCPPAQRAALNDGAAKVRQEVVNTVTAGKSLLAEPSNAALRAPVQEGGSAVARAVKDLLATVNAAGGSGAGAGAGAAPAARGDVDGASRNLTDACKRIEDIIDKVNDEINPRSKLATHGAISGPVSQAELDATAEEVLRRIRELRGYPRKTPKEIAADTDALSTVTAKFGKQLEARGKQVNPALGKVLAELAREIDPPANRAVVDAVNAHLGRPTPASARGVDASADHLEKLVRQTQDAMKPKVQIGAGAARAVPATVTPLHIKEAAEQMKADNRPVKNYATLAPQQLADAVGAVHDDASHLGKLLDKYGAQSSNPAVRSQAAGHADALNDAKADLVRATDAYIQAPDDAPRRQAVERAAARIDELADAIVRTVLPLDDLKRAAPARAGGPVSADELERGGKELIAAENKLAGFRDMTPEEVVAAHNDASTKAAVFAGQLQGRAKQVPQQEVKRALDAGARDIDALNDAQHKAVIALLENPNDGARQRAVDDATKKMNERVNQLLDELFPEAGKQRKHGAFSGAVSPKDIEREGRLAQQKADKPKQHAQQTPKQLVAATEDAFDQVDKLERMLEALERQAETRPATKAAINKAREQLREQSDKLVDSANALVRAPEERARAAALEGTIDAIKTTIDKVIEDVKPKATVAKSSGGGTGNMTPADLNALGKQVQAAARDVQKYKQQTPQETVAKTEAASALAAKFSDAVQDRAKHDKRPGVGELLRAAAPKVDAANKRMVEATNAYTSDPASAAAQKEVDAATNELIAVVQDVLDKLTPLPAMAASKPDYSKKVGMADIERNARDLRAAVLEVKKFPSKAPLQTSKDAEHASKKLVDFCDDLLVRARQIDNPKHKAVLEDGAKRLMARNPQLMNATKAYLGDPDDAATGADLDGVCDLILADLDDVMRQINPKVTIGKGDFAGGKVSPEDLEALGAKVKRKCSVVEQFGNMAPVELAAAATEACAAADDFKEALKARAGQVQNAKAKAALADGAKLIEQRNKELEAAANAHLAEPGDKARQAALAAACQAMKDAVDDVLGRVRPRATCADPNAVKVGAVKPSDLEVSCDEVVKAATDLQGFKNDSPTETKDKADDTSRKAAKYAAQVKKLAEQTSDAAQKTRLMDAYRDLEDANKGVVAATNDYLGDPDSGARQAELHEAAENLKRAARAALEAARPKVDMGGEIGKRTAPVLMPELRDAADALKIAVKPLRAPDALSPDQVKDATEDTNQKALTFLSLAKAKAEQSKDGGKRAALAAIADELNAERKRLGERANARLGDPNAQTNKALKESADKIDALVDKYMDAVKPKATATAAGNTKRETDIESIDAAAEAAKKAVRRLDAGADNEPDDDEIVAQADDASAKLARFTEHVKSLHDETPNKELKEKLAKLLHELADDNKALVSDTNKFVGERPPAARAALGETCKKTVRDIDRAMHEIRDAMKPKSFEDEIDEAAIVIEEAVDQYAHVPAEIRDLAMQLAELFRRLAECARKGDRAGIIQCATAIAAIVKQIIGFAKPYGDSCKDPKLQDTVYVGVQAMGNFSTQLKILAAVKAASQGRDPAAENQLVACCEGLSSGLRQTLYGVQSAKLKK